MSFGLLYIALLILLFSLCKHARRGSSKRNDIDSIENFLFIPEEHHSLYRVAGVCFKLFPMCFIFLVLPVALPYLGFKYIFIPLGRAVCIHEEQDPERLL
jgi:hypothetical protein